MPQPRITREDVTSMVGARHEITAIAAENAGALGVIAAWAGLAGINIAFSRQRRD